ncbi:WD40 repeat-like protein [Neoconidiobolus thromboides FSU 785]|nr:WD40 repeat-like protein [Neoconidiobolus thromboides FSU 785]
MTGSKQDKLDPIFKDKKIQLTPVKFSKLLSTHSPTKTRRNLAIKTRNSTFKQSKYRFTTNQQNQDHIEALANKILSAELNIKKRTLITYSENSDFHDLERYLGNSEGMQLEARRKIAKLTNDEKLAFRDPIMFEYYKQGFDNTIKLCNSLKHDNVLSATLLEDKTKFEHHLNRTNESDQKPLSFTYGDHVPTDPGMKMITWLDENKVAISVSGKMSDAYLFVYDFKADRLYQYQPHFLEDKFNSVCASYCGTKLTLAFSGCIIGILDNEARTITRFLLPEVQLDPELQAMKTYLLSEDLLLISFDNGEIVLYDIAKKIIKNRIKAHFSKVIDFIVTKKGHLVSISESGELKMFDLNNEFKVLLEHCEERGPIIAVDSCPWRPTILALGIGDKKGTIRFLDTYDQKMIDTLVTNAALCNVHFSSKNKEIVTTHKVDDGNIKIWSFPGLGLVKQLKYEKESDRKLLHSGLSPKGTKMVTIHRRRNICLWQSITQYLEERAD